MQMEEILKIVLHWVRRNSAPNYQYKYSRCIVCNCTWWEDEDRHELLCWVPRLESVVEKLDNRTSDNGH